MLWPSYSNVAPKAVGIVLKSKGGKDVHMCHGQIAILGMVIPPLIGILIMGI